MRSVRKTAGSDPEDVQANRDAPSTVKCNKAFRRLIGHKILPEDVVSHARIACVAHCSSDSIDAPPSLGDEQWRASYTITPRHIVATRRCSIMGGRSPQQ